jgi:hypothetical protein
MYADTHTHTHTHTHIFIHTYICTHTHVRFKAHGRLTIFAIYTLHAQSHNASPFDTYKRTHTYLCARARANAQGRAIYKASAYIREQTISAYRGHPSPQELQAVLFASRNTWLHNLSCQVSVCIHIQYQCTHALSRAPKLSQKQLVGILVFIGGKGALEHVRTRRSVVSLRSCGTLRARLLR